MEAASNSTLPAAQMADLRNHMYTYERLIPMIVLCGSIFMFGGPLIK